MIGRPDAVLRAGCAVGRLHSANLCSFGALFERDSAVKCVLNYSNERMNERGNLVNTRN